VAAYDINLDFYLLRLIDVYFFYDSSKYTEISEVAKMTLADLISSIGGLMGLSHV